MHLRRHLAHRHEPPMSEGPNDWFTDCTTALAAIVVVGAALLIGFVVLMLFGVAIFT